MEPFEQASLFRKTINSFFGSNQQLVTRQGRRSHAHIVFFKLVFVQQLELFSGLNDKGYSIFIEKKQLVVVCPRRSRKRSAIFQSLLVINLRAITGLVRDHKSTVVQNIDLTFVWHRSWIVRGAFELAPSDEFVG